MLFLSVLHLSPLTQLILPANMPLTPVFSNNLLKTDCQIHILAQSLLLNSRFTYPVSYLNSHACLLDISILICSKQITFPPNVYLLQHVKMNAVFDCVVKTGECWQVSLIRRKKIKIQKGHLGIWNRKLQSKNCQQYHTLIKCVPTHSLKTMCNFGIQINLFGHWSKTQQYGDNTSQFP